MQMIKSKTEYREHEPRAFVVGIDGLVVVDEVEISVDVAAVVELVMAQMSIRISSTDTLTASVAFEETKNSSIAEHVSSGNFV
jgi:hypothetical protein